RLRKGGSPVPVAMTLSPVVDEEGRVIGASAIFRDMTDRLEVEAHIRRSADRLAALHEIDKAILTGGSVPERASAALPRRRSLAWGDRGPVLLIDQDRNIGTSLAVDPEVPPLGPGDTAPLSDLLPIELMSETELLVIDALAAPERPAAVMERL